MKFLFIGDIVGEPGRKMVKQFVPQMRTKWNLDVVVANNENMAGGWGITPDTYLEISQSGVDVQTGGNHSFDKKEGLPVFQNENDILRPANYPDKNVGRGWCVHTTASGKKLGVINVMGRTFMDPLDCPFQVADRIYSEVSKLTSFILIDIHAEATSEKAAMAAHFDGRATAVIGTHTHVQTGDERILPGGTAFLTDAGMTGPYDSIIGVKKEIIVEKFLTRRGRKFETATGDPWLCGAVVEADPQTGRALKIDRVRIELNRPETHP